MTHVLAVRLDNDGDVLLAGPAVRALAAGADRVTLLCGPRGRRAAELLPGVDDLLVWRAPWIDPEPEPVARGEIEALVRRLAALELDAAVIFGSFHQSPLPTALVLRMAGVPFVAATSVDYPGSLLDVRHRISDDVHEVERALDLAAAAGFPLPAGDDGALRDPARRRARGRGGADRGGAPGRLGAGARVGARAQRRARAGPRRRAAAASSSPARPRSATLTAQVAGPPRPGIADLGGRTTLAELAEVLAGARCVVVGNTGPAHLAAAVGTPVVSLFAPTVPPVRWRPWQVPHELLVRRRPVRGLPRPRLPGRRATRASAGSPRTTSSRPSSASRPWGWRREDPALARPRRVDDRLRPRRPRVRRCRSLPGRGPDGVGIARTYALAARPRDRAAARGAARRAVRRRRAPAPARARARSPRTGSAAGRGATSLPSTSSTTRPRGGSPRCATRRPTATTCCSSTSRTSTRCSGTPARRRPGSIEHGIVDPGRPLQRASSRAAPWSSTRRAGARGSPARTCSTASPRPRRSTCSGWTRRRSAGSRTCRRTSCTRRWRGGASTCIRSAGPRSACRCSRPCISACRWWRSARPRCTRPCRRPPASSPPGSTC